MSRMVSLWEGDLRTRLEGHMLSNGEIHYSWIRNNRNTGLIDIPKEELIVRFNMNCKFNNEQEAKEDFEIFGCLI